MDNIELWCGDCLELMKNIPDDSIDLTVTSPPYDNLRAYNGNISQWSFEKFQEIARELYRVTATGGVVVWVVGDATVKGSETGTSFKQALWFKEIGFNLHDTMIYDKNGTGGAKGSNYCYWQSFEYMFVFSKGKPKSINLICDKENKYATDKKHYAGKRNEDGTVIGRKLDKIKKYGRRTNVWQIANGFMKSTNDKIAYEHPAIFPEQLANDHIISWSNEGDTIFDPFMGSGTTGKMAVLNNRKFIGIELDNTYFEIAKERINKAVENTKSNS